MNYKVCTKCRKKFPATTDYFHRQRRGKFGLHSQCKRCREKYRKQYRLDNCEERLRYGKQWREENPEYDKRWRKNNPEKCCAKTAKRRAMKLNQTPRDADIEKIDYMYRFAEIASRFGTQYHVDHEIPISKSGLHHEDNLRIVSAKENWSKGVRILDNPKGTTYKTLMNFKQAMEGDNNE